MKWVGRGGWLMAALLGASLACSVGGGLGPSGSGLSEQERQALFSAEADPIEVELTLDDGAAVEARIGPEGGALETRSADGTSLRLEIPAGAVAGGVVTVRMTPLAELSGSPFGAGLVAGAHFEPEGLILLEPATLRLELPSEVETTEVYGFLYRGQGQDFSLYPSTVGNEQFVIPVLHFSGAGAVRGNAQAAGQTQARMASELGMRAKSALAVVMAAAERGDRLEAARPDVAAIMDDWWRLAVRSQLEQATSDEHALEAAVREWHQFLGTFSSIQMAGVDLSPADYETEGWPLVYDGVWNTIQAGSSRCQNEHDLGEIRHMLEWVSYLQLVFSQEAGLAEVFDLVRDCATFRLSFESQITQEGGLSGVTEANVAFLVEGELEPLYPAALQIVTQEDPVRYGELEYIAAEGTSALIGVDGSRCTATNVGGSDSEMAAMLLFDNWPVPASEPWRPKLWGGAGEAEALAADAAAPSCAGELCLTLLFDPGEPREQVEGDCLGESTQEQTDQWDMVFWTLHAQSEVGQPVMPHHDGSGEVPVDTAFSFELEGRAERLYGRLTFDDCEEYTFEQGFGRTCETTLIDLWHEPPPR